jgi:hypothetical protein
MKRRELIKNSFYMSGGLWLSQFAMLNKALADGNQNPEIPPQFFVQIVLSTGWHTSLSVDPWILPKRLDETDAFIEYIDSDVLRIGNINMGPAMASLKAFAPNMNVVNGIFLSANDIGHSAAQNYMVSGRGTGEAASLAGEFELSQDPSVFGVIKNSEFYTASKIVDSSSIKEIETPPMATMEDIPFQNADSVIAKAMNSKKQNAAKLESYFSEITKLQSAKVDVKPAHYIATAFKSNLAASSAYTILGYLDTHSDHPVTHLKNQTTMWVEIAEFLNAFKAVEYKNGQSMYDMTTFFITSDFSRTPALDSSKGTNHNPMNNSAVIIGPGFKGNTTFGASRVVPAAESANGTSYLIAQMVDLSTGEILKNKLDAQARGTLIKPETIISTLATGLKIQRNIFTPISESEPAINLILK